MTHFSDHMTFLVIAALPYNTGSLLTCPPPCQCRHASYLVPLLLWVSFLSLFLSLPPSPSLSLSLFPHTYPFSPPHTATMACCYGFQNTSNMWTIVIIKKSTTAVWTHIISTVPVLIPHSSVTEQSRMETRSIWTVSMSL